MSKNITVIADDITGAAEVAGVCLRHGVPVSISFGEVSLGNGVNVIATDTRSMRVEDAVKETGRIAAELKKAGMVQVFKKTDSVFRGHIAAELKTLAKTFQKEKLLLIPSNPYTGRGIRNGKCFVNGVPLHLTSFSNDPEFPRKSSNVSDLINGGEMGVFTGEAVKNRLHKGFNIPDAENQTDLENWVQLISSETLPAGSSAFFEAFLTGAFASMAGTSKTTPHPWRGKALLVSGSTHQYEHAFISNAKDQGLEAVPMPEALKNPIGTVEGIKNWTCQVVDHLSERDCCMLFFGNKKITFENSSVLLKKRMAEAVKDILDRTKLEELLVAGGATAYAIIQELSLGSLELVQEFSPGVVRMKAKDRDLYLTIKPGSYPWPESVTKYLFSLKTKV